MVVFLYTLALICLLFIQGVAVIKLFGLQDCRLVRDNILISIVIGAIADIAVLETLGLFLPISFVTALIVALSVGALLWRAGDIAEAVAQVKQSNLWDAAVILLPILIVGLPQILDKELCSVIYGNGDFAYYFASIDWLKDHSILEPVLYSHAMPHLSMAEYMLKNTRIGLDLMGAFVANLTALDPHQVYPLLAVLTSVMVAASVYSLILRFTKNRVCGMLFGVYSAVCGNNLTLVMLQYVPQIMGTAFLILAFVSIHDILHHESGKEPILCGLLVCGVFAAYCEYAVYIVAFALLMLSFSLLTTKVNFGNIVKAVVFAVVPNVYGFIKAVQFNLWILTSVNDNGMAIIDPYSGTMLDVWYVLGNMLGMSAKNWAAALDSSYKIATIIGLCAVAFIALAFAIRKNKSNKIFVMVSISVFAALGIYFRYSGGAYQEMKHITTAAPMITGLIGLMCADFLSRFQGKAIRNVAVGVFIFVAAISIYSPLTLYANQCIKVDSAFMDLEEAADFVPDSEEIALDDDFSAMDHMRAVYALRNQYININGMAQGNYYSFFQTFDDDVSRYSLVRSDKIEIITDPNIEILWSNNQMMLIENKSIQKTYRLNIASGFSHHSTAIVCHESGTIMNSEGTGDFLLYGPYIDIESGTYDITIEYTVVKSNGNLGFADISSPHGMVWAQAPLEGTGYQELVFENISFDQAQDVEFRVYVNEGNIIKVEGITYRESINEE